MKKYHIKVVNIMLFILLYCLGFSTAHYQHFPFAILYYLYNGESIESYNQNKIYKEQYFGRIADVENYTEANIKVTSKLGVYITFGQSHAVNSGELQYDVNGNVFQFFFGEIFKYEDPALGGNGYGASVWGRVGDKLIESEVHDNVIFANAGYGGLKIDELTSGVHYNYLKNTYDQMIKEYGKVDAILFHQGFSDNLNNTDSELYYDLLEQFITNLKDDEVNCSVVIALSSACYDLNQNIDIVSAQKKLIENFQNIYQGPNSDSLYEPRYRLKDRCHFSSLGQEMLSSEWVNSLQRIDNDL